MLMCVVAATTVACLMQVLNTDFSPGAAAACMNRLAKLSARFIGNRGFSIGIDDVTPAPRLVKAKQKAVDAGYSKVQGFIADYSKGQLQQVPGCDQEESLEHSVTDVLNGIRQDAADVGTPSRSQAMLCYQAELGRLESCPHAEVFCLLVSVIRSAE